MLHKNYRLSLKKGRRVTMDDKEFYKLVDEAIEDINEEFAKYMNREIDFTEFEKNRFHIACEKCYFNDKIVKSNRCEEFLELCNVDINEAEEFREFLNL